MTPAPRPVRMQRRRTPGYDMQAESRAANGLPGTSITRPGPFGNPISKGGWFRIGAAGEPLRWQACAPEIAKYDDRFAHVQDNATAAALYALMIARHGPPRDARALVGRNLFCFCPLCARHKPTGKPFDEDCPDCSPCHADALGRAVAAMICDEV
jgi:hypothetical protein